MNQFSPYLDEALRKAMANQFRFPEAQISSTQVSKAIEQIEKTVKLMKELERIQSPQNELREFLDKHLQH